MNLESVRKFPLKWKKRFRAGLGKASGLGKTAGRGGRGQTARSGHSLITYFEGGQMPLARKLPKRGFNNRRFARVYATVNVEALNAAFKDGEIVTPESLVERGLIDTPAEGVRILGDGVLQKKLTVRALFFTKQALQKIQKAGGQAETVVKPRPYAGFASVRVGQIDKKFKEGDDVTPQSLAQAGLLKNPAALVKIEYGGVLKKKITVRAHRFSRLAMDKIRGAGGQAIVLAVPAAP